MSTRGETGVSMSNRLTVARQLARQLREAKSTHEWTNRECGLLGDLCEVLRVDGDPPRPGPRE